MKAMLKIVLGLTLVTMMICGNASAQQLEAGMTEFNGQVSINNMSGDDVDMTMTTISVGAGRFISDVSSVGIQIMRVGIDADGDDTSYMFINGRYDYHFTAIAGGGFPYVGAHAGLIMLEIGDEDETEINYGVQGGIKYFLTESTALNLEANYTMYEVMDEELDNLQFLAGLSVFM